MLSGEACACRGVPTPSPYPPLLWPKQAVAALGFGIVSDCRPLPFDGGVLEVPDAVDARGGVAIVKVPARHAVVGDIDLLAKTSSNGAFDSAISVAVNPEDPGGECRVVWGHRC